MSRFIFFACGRPTVPIPFIEKIILSPLNSAMYWIVSPQNSYTEALTPNVVVSGGGVFERYLVVSEIMGVRALMLGIIALIRRDTRDLTFSLSPHMHSNKRPCEHSEKVVICKPEREPSPELPKLAPWSQTYSSRTVRK